MPPVVSSSSTNAWARVQSCLASHHNAISGAESPFGGSSGTRDALNSSWFIVASRLYQLSFQAGPGSTLLRSRCEERRPLLFDLRATTCGTLDLALFVFGKS